MLSLLLLNGLNQDKEVIAPLFKIRRLGLRSLETPCLVGQNSLLALPSTSLNKEVVTSLSYLSRLAATGVFPQKIGKKTAIASDFQKNPRVRKIRVRNSGAGNGCANFMDTWKTCVLSAGKTMSVKFPFFWGGFGGGECRFYFYGRADFSEIFHRKENSQGFLGGGGRALSGPKNIAAICHLRCFRGFPSRGASFKVEKAHFAA